MNGNDQPAPYTFICADDPATGLSGCTNNMNTDELGNFSFDLPPNFYILTIFRDDPLSPVMQRIDARSADQTDIELTLDKIQRPFMPDAPPVAELISISTPNAQNQVTVTGSAGSVPPLSALILINLNTGHIGQEVANGDGSFTASMTSHPGTIIQIKADPIGFIAGVFAISHPPEITGSTDIITGLSGTTLRVPSESGSESSSRNKSLVSSDSSTSANAINGTLSGTVTEAGTGTPVYPVVVSLMDPDTGADDPNLWISNNADGSYQISDVPPGPWILFFNAVSEADDYQDELYDDVFCDNGNCDRVGLATKIEMTEAGLIIDEDLVLPGFVPAHAITAAGLTFDPNEGGDSIPPLWTFNGHMDELELNQGDELEVQGTLELTSTALEDTPTINCTAIFRIEMLSDANGKGVTALSNYMSTLLTPTGLPIERSQVLVDQKINPGYPFTLSTTSPGVLSTSIAAKLPITSDFPPGYYRPFIDLCYMNVPSTSPVDQHMTVLESGLGHLRRRIYLPIVRVGEPQPAHLYLTLLGDTLSNGTRGATASEDQQHFGLANRIVNQSPVFTVPGKNSTGIPITYRLEPFAPTISSGDRTPARAPLIPFKFPSGNLQVMIKKPDGSQQVLGPVPFVQSRMRTPTDERGSVLDSGGGHITDMFQLSTMDPQFDVEFEQEGLYEITMDGQIEDLWGNLWSGGGTYEVHVASTLVADTTVLPGTVFEVGDHFQPGITFSPAIPANVEATLVVLPNSDPNLKIEHQISGQANRFGLFQPLGGAIELTQPGEYRYDLTATYRDEDGNQWVASRTFSGVIAPTNPTIIGHGRRGIDTEPEIGKLWYTRTDTGQPVGGNHLHMPFATGDVLWIEDIDSITTTMRFQDTGGSLAPLLKSRIGCCEERQFDGPGNFDQQASVGEIPLFISRPDLIDAHMDPSKIDLWAYSYRSIQRPLVRVREIIAGGHTDSPYWRFGEKYADQVGMGGAGDLPNDLKFQYGGVVLRGSALPNPEYGIYGSVVVMVPDGDEHGGSRVFPPFQGNGGGPSGGPLFMHKGEAIEGLINLRGTRPGSIFEVGETFSLSGAIAPTLPALVDYTVTRPDGSKLEFTTSESRRANAVGYYYQPADDFTLDQPGLWTVDLGITFDGSTSAGQLTSPFPTGDVLGSSNGRLYFYVTSAGAKQIKIDLPSYHVMQPEHLHDGANYTINIQSILPAGYSAQKAHVTTMMPGTILESRELTAGLSYSAHFNELSRDVPNLDVPLADLITVSLFIEATDKQGQKVFLGRVINLHGPEVFSLEVTPIDPMTIFDDSFE